MVDSHSSPSPHRSKNSTYNQTCHSYSTIPFSAPNWFSRYVLGVTTCSSEGSIKFSLCEVTDSKCPSCQNGIIAESTSKESM